MELTMNSIWPRVVLISLAIHSTPLWAMENCSDMDISASHSCLESDGVNLSAPAIYSLNFKIYDGWVDCCWDVGYELSLCTEELFKTSDLSQILVKHDDKRIGMAGADNSMLEQEKEALCISEIACLSLILVDSKLRAFPPGLTKLTNLVELNVNYNEFNSIPQSVSELKKLSHLLITHNQIRELPSELFSISLKALNLNNNQLTSVDPAIRRLSLLQKLALDNNKIKVIPQELFDLVRLKYLSLADNLLRELPPELGNLRELETLILCGNTHLRELPSTTTLLTSLRALSVKNTGLSRVGVIASLTGLATLNIGRVGPACKLLQNLQTLPQLTRLFMPWNALHKLKDEVPCAYEYDTALKELEELPRKLMELDLQYNRLLKIPATILQCDTLLYLDLSGNFLKEIPPDISSLINLENLLLSDNNLSTMPDSLARLTKLRVLRLNLNQLEELPVQLYNLDSLTNLDVMHNPCGLSQNTHQAASVAMILYRLAGKKCMHALRFLCKCVYQTEEVTLREIKILLNKLKRSFMRASAHHYEFLSSF